MYCLGVGGALAGVALTPCVLMGINWSGLPVLQSVDGSSHSTWALAIGQADTVRMATPDMAATPWH